MLIIDGVRYKLWTPTSEEDLAKMVKEHAKDIFGENSLFFDLKQRITSKSGVISIPDGYSVIFGEAPRWCIIEVELSSHPLYEHIVPQITKFINGIEKPESRKEVVEAIYKEIRESPATELFVKEKIGSGEIYKSLSDLISRPPTLVVIIEEKTEELNEIKKTFPSIDTQIVEFKTFEREGIGLGVHAHLFTPLFVTIVEPPFLDEKLSNIKVPEIKKFCKETIESLEKIGVSLRPLKRRWVSLWYKGKRFGYMGFRIKFFVFDLPTDSSYKKWFRTRVFSNGDWEKLFAEKIKPILDAMEKHTPFNIVKK
jgi:hypothetical protein